MEALDFYWHLIRPGVLPIPGIQDYQGAIYPDALGPGLVPVAAGSEGRWQQKLYVADPQGGVPRIWSGLGYLGRYQHSNWSTYFFLQFKTFGIEDMNT